LKKILPLPVTGRILERQIMTPYVFQRGETISLALDAVSGDPAGVSAITAKLKAVPPGRTSVPAGAATAASFAVAPRPAEGDVPPGWTLTVSAATSSALSACAYLADARIEIGGGVIVTESVAIRIRESVSA
jgi:hypothetical protein